MQTSFLTLGCWKLNQHRHCKVAFLFTNNTSSALHHVLTPLFSQYYPFKIKWWSVTQCPPLTVAADTHHNFCISWSLVVMLSDIPHFYRLSPIRRLCISYIYNNLYSLSMEVVAAPIVITCSMRRWRINLGSNLHELELTRLTHWAYVKCSRHHGTPL